MKIEMNFYLNLALLNVSDDNTHHIPDSKYEV